MRYTTKQVDQMVADQEYWDVIAEMFGVKLVGFTDRRAASFTEDLRVEDSRVAEVLHKRAIELQNEDKSDDQ